MNAEEVIQKLKLEPLPEEGGFYREAYRSSLELPTSALPGYDSPRIASTAIYYLITPETFSLMHRLRTDEVFHFYLGDPVEILLLNENGIGEMKVLGNDLSADENLQLIVEADVWQGARLKAGGTYALMGTTMAPGFEFEDFELGERKNLRDAYSHWEKEIVARTRKTN